MSWQAQLECELFPRKVIVSQIAKFIECPGHYLNDGTIERHIAPVKWIEGDANE